MWSGWGSNFMLAGYYDTYLYQKGRQNGISEIDYRLYYVHSPLTMKQRVVPQFSITILKEEKKDQWWYWDSYFVHSILAYSGTTTCSPGKILSP